MKHLVTETHLKTLERQIPIRACALAGEVHALVRIVVVVVHDLGQAKIRNPYVAAEAVPAAEQDVAGLDVVVDDGRLDLVEVLEGRDDLHDDAAGLLLRDSLVLFQLEILETVQY